MLNNNNHTTESSATGDSAATGAMTSRTPTAVGETSSVYIPATAGSTAIAVSVSGSATSSTNVGTSANASTTPVAGTSAAEITLGANRLASELREFMQAHEQSFLVTSSAVTNIHNNINGGSSSKKSSNSLESIGSASWPAVKEDATADLQLATCRKLREVSLSGVVCDFDFDWLFGGVPH
jgi:hypothetical protein